MSPWRAVVAFVSRVRDLCGRRRLAREAEQEIEMHLDLLTAQYVRAGNTPAEARRLARAKFGGVAQVRESLRDQAGFPVLESILHDVRYAARSLVRQPGTTALAVGILALGLGVNTAVLAVAYACSGGRCRTRTRTGWLRSRGCTRRTVRNRACRSTGSTSGTAVSGRCGWPATTRGPACCAARVRPA